MISVVIPLYNKAHTIVDTLRSVMCQTHTDFEVIIVNDGSTDNGVEVIKQNFDDPRIRIINQENQGVSVARDRGVEEAQSNYIAFLDADDKWHPEYLRIMSIAISRYPNAALYSSGGLIYNADGSVSYRLVNKYLNKIVTCDFFENPHVYIHTSATIINKSFFKLTDGSPRGMRRLEDFALFFQIALKGPFVYIGLPISKYVGGVPGQTTSNKLENKFEALKCFCFLYNFISEKNRQAQNKSLKAFFRYALRHNFKYCINERDYNSLYFYLENLSSDCLSLFHKWELMLYKSGKRILSILWIDTTKILWRLSGKPVVNGNIELSKIDSQYLNW